MHPILSEHIHQWLQAVLAGPVSLHVERKVVQYAIAYATALLKTRYRRYLPLIEKAGYTAAEAGCVCIEELFSGQSTTPCHRLSEALRAMIAERKDSNGNTHVYAYHGIIMRLMDQGVPRLLAEYDPEYRKVLRNVSIYMHDAAFQPVVWFHESAWRRRPMEECLTELPECAPDLLLPALASRASTDGSIGELVEVLFDLLDEQESWRRIMTQHQIVVSIRDFQLLFWRREETHSPDPGMDILLRDLEADIPAVVQRASEGILRHYLQNGTLSTELAALYMKAAEQYLSDLIKADTEPFFYYFSMQCPEVSHKDYRTSRRIQFEYVLNSVKEAFIETCRHTLVGKS